MRGNHSFILCGHNGSDGTDLGMGGMQWLLDLVLVLLLAATLFHAIRLERALGVLKRDRAALETLVEGFNASTREAQAGIERLRSAADGAGRAVARQTEAATTLRDDLCFLIERGEKLADRLDQLVRASRLTLPEAPPAPVRAALPSWGDADPSDDGAPAPAPARVRSRAERDLLAALRVAR